MEGVSRDHIARGINLTLIERVIMERFTASLGPSRQRQPFRIPSKSLCWEPLYRKPPETSTCGEPVVAQTNMCLPQTGKMVGKDSVVWKMVFESHVRTCAPARCDWLVTEENIDVVFATLPYYSNLLLVTMFIAERVYRTKFAEPRSYLAPFGSGTEEAPEVVKEAIGSGIEATTYSDPG